MSKYRNKIKNKRKDQKVFTRSADKIHKFNLDRYATRGGIRL